jgi:hypothetical protein
LVFVRWNTSNWEYVPLVVFWSWICYSVWLVSSTLSPNKWTTDCMASLFCTLVPFLCCWFHRQYQCKLILRCLGLEGRRRPTVVTAIVIVIDCQPEHFPWLPKNQSWLPFFHCCRLQQIARHTTPIQSK